MLAARKFNSSRQYRASGLLIPQPSPLCSTSVGCVTHTVPAQPAPQPPLQRGALGCGKELTRSRDLPGREKSAGKMSPWLFLGWSHHCPLPKDRAKSVVAAEPMITAHYTLPCLEQSTPLIPPLKPPAAHGPGAGTGAKSHDVPQGFACSKNGPCVPP